MSRKGVRRHYGKRTAAILMSACMCMSSIPFTGVAAEQEQGSSYSARTEDGGQPGTGGSAEENKNLGISGNTQEGQNPGAGGNTEEGQNPGTGGNTEEGQNPGTGGNTEEGQNPGTGGNTEEGQNPGAGGNTEEGQNPGTGENGEEGQNPGEGGNTEEGQNPGAGGNEEDGQNPGEGGDPEEGQNPGTGENGEEGQNPGEGEDPEEGQNPGTGENGEDNLNPEEDPKADADKKPEAEKPNGIEKPAEQEKSEPTEAMNAVYDQIDALPAMEELEADFEDDSDIVGMLEMLQNLRLKLESIREAYENLTSEEQEAFDSGRLEKLVGLEALSTVDGMSMMFGAVGANAEVKEVTLEHPLLPTGNYTFAAALEIIDQLSPKLDGGTFTITLTAVPAPLTEEIAFQDVDIELDLAGMKLDLQGGLSLDHTNLTIIGDSGEIDGDVTVDKKSSFSIGSGTFDGNMTIDGNSSLTIETGTFTGDFAAKGDSSLTIKDGTFTGNFAVSGNGSSGNISKGEVTGNISLSDTSSMQVGNGTITGDITLRDHSSVQIGNGTVEGDITLGGTSSMKIGDGTYNGKISANDTSVLEIAKGSFNGGSAGPALNAGKESKVTLNGGTFTTTAGDKKAIVFSYGEKEIDQFWGKGKMFKSLVFATDSVDNYSIESPVEVVDISAGMVHSITDTVTQHMVDRVFGGKDVAKLENDGKTITLLNNAGETCVKNPILIDITGITIDLNDSYLTGSFTGDDAVIKINKNNVSLTIKGKNSSNDSNIFDREKVYEKNSIWGRSGTATSPDGTPAIGISSGVTGSKVIIGKGVEVHGGDGAHAYTGYGSDRGGNGADAVKDVAAVDLFGCLIGGDGGRAVGNGNGGNGGNGSDLSGSALTLGSDVKLKGGNGGTVPADGSGSIGSAGKGQNGVDVTEANKTTFRDGRNGYHLTEAADASKVGMELSYPVDNLGQAVYEDSDQDNQIYVTISAEKAQNASDIAAIQAKLKTGEKIGVIFDLTMKKQIKAVTGLTTVEVYQTKKPVILFAALPPSMRGGSDYRLIHVHNGAVTENDVSYNGGGIKISTSNFSTFAVAYKPKTSSGSISSGGGGGGGGSSTRPRRSEPAGQWVQNTTGWWYKNNDGSWPKDQWDYLTYDGKSRWYRFNKEGYLITGWFTDIDGSIYYLHPVSDGNLGYMYTGWRQIDGEWYYFNANSIEKQGILLKNTVTPDGYKVNEKGIWVAE